MSFNDDLRRGHDGEAFLDALFGHEFIISEPPGAQRRGIDRLFTPRNGLPPFTVEYKTDRTAARTHNAFVETVSVDTRNIAGWAYTSKADYLAYYIPAPEDLIYIIEFGELRTQLDGWAREFPTRSIRNDGYFTKGLLVPLDEFERIADEVIDSSGKEGR